MAALDDAYAPKASENAVDAAKLSAHNLAEFVVACHTYLPKITVEAYREEACHLVFKWIDPEAAADMAALDDASSPKASENAVSSDENTASTSITEKPPLDEFMAALIRVLDLGRDATLLDSFSVGRRGKVVKRISDLTNILVDLRKIADRQGLTAAELAKEVQAS
jgi:hypothetical protein